MNGGIYVHVPFCRSRCSYCSFYSIAGKTLPDSRKYANAIINHFNSFKVPHGILFNSVYFGGGTPSLMPVSFFNEVLEYLAGEVDLSEHPEITIEMNPEDAVPVTLNSLKMAGINRISIGVQSTDDGMLQKLNRSHTAKEAFSAIVSARETFENVSCDLIIGIEGEADSGKRILQGLPVEALSHLSLYMLDGAKNSKLAADSDHTADLYTKLCGILAGLGLEQYEISNFSRPGMKSVHNLHYWKGNPYIGLGPSAHSLLYPFRIRDHSGVKNFMNGMFKTDRIEYSEPVFVREMLMLALRLKEGASVAEFENRYGIDLVKEFSWLCEKFSGFVKCDGKSLALTSEGMLLSNEIFQELV